jgi:hypothetical protein
VAVGIPSSGNNIGRISYEDDRLIKSVLHPDANPSPERRAEAFMAYEKLRLIVAPRRVVSNNPFPTDVNELMRRRDEVQRQNSERAKASWARRKATAEGGVA